MEYLGDFVFSLRDCKDKTRYSISLRPDGEYNYSAILNTFKSSRTLLQDVLMDIECNFEVCEITKVDDVLHMTKLNSVSSDLGTVLVTSSLDLFKELVKPDREDFKHIIYIDISDNADIYYNDPEFLNNADLVGIYDKRFDNFKLRSEGKICLNPANSDNSAIEYMICNSKDPYYDKTSSEHKLLVRLRKAVIAIAKAALGIKTNNDLFLVCYESFLLRFCSDLYDIKNHLEEIPNDVIEAIYKYNVSRYKFTESYLLEFETEYGSPCTSLDAFKCLLEDEYAGNTELYKEIDFKVIDEHHVYFEYADGCFILSFFTGGKLEAPRVSVYHSILDNDIFYIRTSAYEPNVQRDGCRVFELKIKDDEVFLLNRTGTRFTRTKEVLYGKSIPHIKRKLLLS